MKYSWNHLSATCGAAAAPAATSSSVVPAAVLTIETVPAAAAARATPISPSGMDEAHEPARRTEHGERDRRAEHRGAQVGLHVHGDARAERHVLEGALVLAQRHLAVGRAVDEVEHHPGQHRRARRRASPTL